ncbi:hypothetical protein [Rhodococcus sp. SGAir0479]|uniref:hypothetical protein n=1 Tax=Rhodococcus sp. SGAir0479 TaxID=2567884 RepID=UPI0020C7711C|nr:hypothetical protein [Rhodococcus sp. SGAir0479]
MTGGAAAAAALSLAVLLTACGSEESDPAPAADPAPEVTAPATPAAGPITDGNALRAALPTTADLAPGFAVLPDTPDDPAGRDADDATDASSTDPARCANVLDTIARQSPGAVATAEQNFSGPGFTSIDVDAASYAGSGAADAFAAVQASVRTCTTFTGTDALGTAVEYRVEPLARPDAGDAAIAFRVTTTSEGFTLVSDAVVTSVDSTVVQVVTTGPDALAGDDTTVLARTTAQRVHAAAGPR